MFDYLNPIIGTPLAWAIMMLSYILALALFFAAYYYTKAYIDVWRERKKTEPLALQRRRFTLWHRKWKPTNDQLTLLLLLAISKERNVYYDSLASSTGWSEDYVRMTVSSLAGRALVDSSFDMSRDKSYAYIQIPGREYLFRSGSMEPNGKLSRKAAIHLSKSAKIELAFSASQ